MEMKLAFTLSMRASSQIVSNSNIQNVDVALSNSYVTLYIFAQHLN